MSNISRVELTFMQCNFTSFPHSRWFDVEQTTRCYIPPDIPDTLQTCQTHDVGYDDERYYYVKKKSRRRRFDVIMTLLLRRASTGNRPDAANIGPIPPQFCHINLLMICHHCFRQWLVACSAPSHGLNQLWPSLLTHVCISMRTTVTELTKNHDALCCSITPHPATNHHPNPYPQPYVCA